MSNGDRGGPGLAEPVLRALVLAMSFAFIAIFLGVAWLRIPFPFELEWVEGSILLQAQRILSGETLYVAPSLHFVPVTYPPLYQYLSAAVCAVTGVSYPPLRVISLLATLGCFAVLYRHVARETGSRVAGIAAAGLFAAAFRVSGAWFDTAHVDSLHLLWQLLAIYYARFGATRGGQIRCGMLLAAAFLTKQSGLAAALPVLLACVVLHGRIGIWATVCAGLLGGGATLALHLGSDGWYGYYLFGQYASHGFVDRMWLGFWTEDIARHFAPAVVGTLLVTFWQWRLRPRERFFFYGLVGAGMIAMAYSSRVHLGGFDNVLMPGCAWAALMLGLALAPADDDTPVLPARLTPAFVYALCAIQFGLLAYDPREQLPSKADVEVGNRLLTAFAEIDGEIFVPSRNYLPVLAGSPPSIHNTAMGGIFGDHRLPEGRALSEEFSRALREQRYALIVSSGHEPYQEELDRYYKLRPSVFTAADRDAFWPVTGLQTRPYLFYVPRKSSP